ncbi:hypothetical protein GWI34_00015 [Actinomadura sp. DSM 109109]|nr:hypothetical protein [Actinomadura lepetitiana]
MDLEAREELRTLPKDLATKVARHLVMAGRLAEDEPEQAYRHAKAARRLASRVGIVREAAGIAAYHAGEWAEALAELRAARRLGAGDYSYLPVMADCERGLGRPERALDVIKSPEAERLDPMGRVELRIVESGVRRDMGQTDAAVVTLQIPELRDRRLRPWSVRLFYAYADALVEAEREEEASDWFARAAAADRDGETDAAERYAELEGLQILDTEGDEDAGDLQVQEPAGPSAEGPAGAEATSQEEAHGETAEPLGADESGAAAEQPSQVEGSGIEDSGEAGGVAGAEEHGEAARPAGESVEDVGAGQSEEAAESSPVEESGEPGEGSEAKPARVEGSATDIAFRPAEPEVADVPEEGAPEAPAVFLEPKQTGGERPPAD